MEGVLIFRSQTRRSVAVYVLLFVLIACGRQSATPSAWDRLANARDLFAHARRATLIVNVSGEGAFPNGDISGTIRLTQEPGPRVPVQALGHCDSLPLCSRAIFGHVPAHIVQDRPHTMDGHRVVVISDAGNSGGGWVQPWSLTVDAATGTPLSLTPLTDACSHCEVVTYSFMDIAK
jgi:hypothetical protein